MLENKRAETLRLLRESGENVSGQDLCEHFGISRTAVWKIMNQLKEEGYEIEAVQNKIVKDVFEYRAKINAAGSGVTPQKYLELYGPTGSILTPLDKMKLHAQAYWFGNGDFKIKEVANELQYGVYLAFGFNTWNPYIYYGLNPIFDKNKTTLENNVTALNIGLKFYIL